MADEDWNLLWSLLDAILPSITSESKATDPENQLVLPDEEYEEAVDRMSASLATRPSKNDIREYLAQRPSLNEDFRDDVRVTLGLSPQRLRFARALTFLR